VYNGRIHEQGARHYDHLQDGEEIVAINRASATKRS